MEETNFHYDRHLYAVRPLPGWQVILALSWWDCRPVFQAKMLLPEREELLHVDSVYRIVMLHMVYGKTHGGNERGFWPPGKWRSSQQQGYTQKVYLPLTLLSACYCFQESNDIAFYGSNYHLWIWEMMLPSENAGSCIRQSVMMKCVGIRGHTLISCNKARSWVRSGPLFP